ncbi:flavodoxin-dependent (E)-4-hydroxy-3-methylbut-2-enyl-diphosphate synthase [Desulfonatronovibrio hydrogenovorans]|uniref:flavodoxin-dependent (E)-4-hydroxy-3-methylbut-2-enyl-diphosphate synthase n=1 Tax=Desulfonatronovibrio hydrogenovorans TaxID=53245 RepID=UPI00048F8CF0|nr:flavodoxin-dependent (E)-4-hydroxy-3-methylbut-2-enyl-diphosphate synthase [Desulfonatronovibrio hydrogenovorans]
MNRKKTRQVMIGNVGIGGDNPVRVQSMTNTDTRDVRATLDQINQLVLAGCELVRVAVPDAPAASRLKEIIAGSPVPVVADIHFDHRLALKSIEAGINGLRLNPGNIGDQSRVNRVVDAAKSNIIPIRIGVNSGSVDKTILKKYGGPTPEAMVESAMGHIRMLEDRGFELIKISLKSSSVLGTIEAYRLMADQRDYPLHIGITEAGTPMRGAVKSGVGLGVLLYQGLGDTLRVSLTGDPVNEMPVAWEILRSLGLRQRGPDIISCPTCGRTEIDLTAMAEAVEKKLRNIEKVFTVAIMGCVVNGPGEAREADIGLAGGRDCGIIFKKGEMVKKVKGGELLSEFMRELDEYLRLT